MDSMEKKGEEVVSPIFFCIGKDNVIRTPALGSILPGVTRASIIELARDLGYKVEECVLPLTQALDAKEAWCTGTAAVLTPVASITHNGTKHSFDPSAPTARKLFDAFQGILSGALPDKRNWLVDPFKQ